MNKKQKKAGFVPTPQYSARKAAAQAAGRAKGAAKYNIFRKKLMTAAKKGVNQVTHEQLVKAVETNSLPKLGSILGEGVKNIGTEHLAPIILKEFPKLGSLGAVKGADKIAEIVLTRTRQAGKQRVSVLQTHGGMADTSDMQMGKSYYLKDHIKAFKTEALIQSEKSNKKNKIFTYQPVNNRSGRDYFQHGLNCKGLCGWNLDLVNVSASTWSNESGVTTSAYPLTWGTRDYEQLLTSGPIALPTSELSDTSQDMYFPISSGHMEFRLINSNRFIPITVKVYVLRLRTGVGSTSTESSPVKAWVGTNEGIQTPNAMDNAYYMHRSESTNIGDDFLDEISVLTDTSPNLSSNFKASYEVIKIHSIDLESQDQLFYHFGFDFSKPQSVKEIWERKVDQIGAYTNDYSLMISFQGKGGIVVPRESGGDGLPIYSKSLFSRVRVDVRKYGIVAYKSLVDGLTADYAASSVYVPNLDDKLVTASYSQLSTSSGADGTYYIPVWTDRSKQDGGGISTE